MKTFIIRLLIFVITYLIVLLVARDPSQLKALVIALAVTYIVEPLLSELT